MDHLPAVEALLALPRCCCCTTPMAPLVITGISHKLSSFQDTFHNNHINNQYGYFIFYVFLISPINIFILCSTIVIISSFHFEHGSFLLKLCNITCFPEREETQFSPLTRLDCHFSDFLNLLAEVAFRPLLRFFTISGVLGLRFKEGWSRWKAKTRAYKSSERRRTHFCP